MKKQKSTSVLYVSGLQYNAGPEKKAKFDKWFEEEHVPIQFKARGMKKAIRYKLGEPVMAGKAEDYPDYLTVYEFEDRKSFDEYRTGPVYDEVHQNVMKNWPEGRPFKIMWRLVYETVTEWNK